MLIAIGVLQLIILIFNHGIINDIKECRKELKKIKQEIYKGKDDKNYPKIREILELSQKEAMDSTEELIKLNKDIENLTKEEIKDRILHIGYSLQAIQCGYLNNDNIDWILKQITYNTNSSK